MPYSRLRAARAADCHSNRRKARRRAAGCDSIVHCGARTPRFRCLAISVQVRVVREYFAGKMPHPAIAAGGGQ